LRGVANRALLSESPEGQRATFRTLLRINYCNGASRKGENTLKKSFRVDCGQFFSRTSEAGAVLIGLICLVPRPAQAVVNYSLNWKPNVVSVAYAACLDAYGYGVPGASVSVTVNWVANSNSHLHPNTSGHPKSVLSPSSGITDSTGNLQMQIQTSQVGQDEYATITCSKPGWLFPVGTKYFTVGYADVYYNDHPEFWEKVGATSNHGSVFYNRYMMTSAAYNLYYTTQDYRNFFEDTSLIGANDQALPYGGVFDLNSNWNPPHTYHYRGTAGDMRGNMQAYSIPVSRQQWFVDRCTFYGAALAQIEYANPNDSDAGVADQRRHVHCHWPLVP